MSRLIFDSEYLNVEELILENSNFQKMISDNKITDDEKKDQSDRVIGILNQLDEICSDEEIELIKKLLAELCVLVAINRM
ncbi:MAG: hypothetical protein E7080_08050 [Bacteroidales bacterium]|nr:hypothetical protein [Bacteroidales bacterium]